jgi:hypothetical protein
MGGDSTLCTQQPPRRFVHPRPDVQRRQQHRAPVPARQVTHVVGLALAAGPERWTGMEGGSPVIVDGECIGGVGVSGGDRTASSRVDRCTLANLISCTAAISSH